MSRPRAKRSSSTKFPTCRVTTRKNPVGEVVRRKPNKRCFSWKSPRATGRWTWSRATDTRSSSSSCLTPSGQVDVSVRRLESRSHTHAWSNNGFLHIKWTIWRTSSNLKENNTTNKIWRKKICVHPPTQTLQTGLQCHGCLKNFTFFFSIKYPLQWCTIGKI